MNALLRTCAVVSISLLAVGCSLARADTSLDGESFVLTADEPVAAFEITLCLDGPVPRTLEVEASISASLHTTTDVAQLRIESLSDQPTEERANTLDVSSDGAELSFFYLLADGPWSDGGRRCSTPEVIEFSADGLAAGNSLNVEHWTVDMNARWEDGAFGDGPTNGDLSVMIERL